jgi:hypothetical protein|eukprot:COSAG06_NODE_722_length_12802_cov_6.036763_6_plen_120_part_00
MQAQVRVRLAVAAACQVRRITAIISYLISHIPGQLLPSFHFVSCGDFAKQHVTGSLLHGGQFLFLLVAGLVQAYVRIARSSRTRTRLGPRQFCDCAALLHPRRKRNHEICEDVESSQAF